MSRILVRRAGAIALLAFPACHGGAPADTATSRSERTVFTDSAMHARLCQPTRPGEDWHRVCTPIDQGVTTVVPKSPPHE